MPIAIQFYRKWFRLSARSFKTWAFLGTALLTGLMILYSIRENEVVFIVKDFSVATAALLAFLLFGTFETPKIDRLCARFPWVVYGAVSVLIFLQMEITNSNSLGGMRFVMIVWNVVTIFAVFIALWAICGNFRIAGLAGMLLFEVWGIANYLTVDFRGIPIAPNDLMSAGTALNVLGGYRLTIRMKLAAFFALSVLVLMLLLRIPLKASSGKRIRQRIAAFLCVAVFFWQGCFGALNLIDMLQLQWDWRRTYYSNGYTAVSIAKIEQLFTAVPAGYSSSEVQQLLQKEQERPHAAQPDTDVRPNIILILNESWFDWRQITDFETDVPAMPFIDSLENSIKDFAVGPEENAGTSLSEYELLTSNCLDLMPGLTPFTLRNLEGSYSVVSYIKDLGYTTAALHPASSANYNRQIVYPQFGFERIEFQEGGIWENRLLLRGYMSDHSAYDVVEEVFEEKNRKNPAFIYLLTIQNHGDYDSTRKNGGASVLPEESEINLISGFDAIKGKAEEYLSCKVHRHGI